MPAGRPPKLDAELIGKIEKAVAAGLYKETASALHGVPRSTLLDWLRRGAEEKQRVETLRGEGVKGVRVTARERIYVELSDAVERAIALADARDLGIVDKTAQGGLETKTRITKTRTYPKLGTDGKPMMDANGVAVQVIEIVHEEKITHSLPEWTAAAWKLERRNPQRFGRRTYKELTGADGKDLIPLEAIRAVLAGAGDVEDADWEYYTGDELPAASAGLLKPGAAADPSNPEPDLPEE